MEVRWSQGVKSNEKSSHDGYISPDFIRSINFINMIGNSWKWFFLEV